MPQSVCLWLYRDLTEVYKARFPEAGVRAVAVRYEVKGISGEIIRERGVWKDLTEFGLDWPDWIESESGLPLVAGR